MRIFVLFEAVMVLFFIWCAVNVIFYFINKITGYGVEGGGFFALANWMAQGEKKKYQKDKERRDRE